MPGLRGHYFYADFCKGWVRSFRHREGRAVDPRGHSLPALPFTITFGTDSAGELYVLPYTGKIYRIVPAN